MAVTVQRYNHTLSLFLNQEVDLTGIYVMLLDDTASFDATDTDIGDVASTTDSDGLRDREVAGNGWDIGGEHLANAGFTTVAADSDSIANDSLFDGDDISVTATGGPIGPAYNAVVWDKTNNYPLFFLNFGKDEEGGETAGEDTDFKFLLPLGLWRVRDYPS